MNPIDRLIVQCELSRIVERVLAADVAQFQRDCSPTKVEIAEFREAWGEQLAEFVAAELERIERALPEPLTSRTSTRKH